MTDDYKTLRDRLRNELASLGRQLDKDASGGLLVWVLPERLACSHRPLRHHPVFGGSRRDLPPKARKDVLEWVDSIKSYGIVSIITLMHPKELRHYDALNLEGGLLGTYRNHGFELCHLPWDDPAHRPQSQLASFSSELERIQQEALNAFDALPKPVLLHCSAGIDRSSPVAAFIATQRSHFRRTG